MSFSENCPRILIQELVELTTEIKDFSNKNHRILEKIKSFKIPEVLQTLPKSLFSIESFSSLSPEDIRNLDKKTAEKLKAKALHAFDVLMNEEVLLERIHSRCNIINQASKNEENVYRKKAINHLATDLIPSFLPYTQKKYTKFVKSSQKLINEMKLGKKKPREAQNAPLRTQNQNPQFKNNEKFKEFDEDKELEDRIEGLNDRIQYLTENFKETAKNVHEDISNLKEIIKLDDLEDEKEKYKKLTLDSFSSSSNKSEYKENSREEIIGKYQDFQLILRRKKDMKRPKRSLSLLVRPFQIEPQFKQQTPEKIQNSVLSAKKGKENIKDTLSDATIVKEFTTKIIDALGMNTGKKEDFSSENLEKILLKIQEKEQKFIEERENFLKESQILSIEKELLKLEWEKLENQKKELQQIEKLRKIETLSRKFQKS